MTTSVQRLMMAFDALAAAEQREAAVEISRRVATNGAEMAGASLPVQGTEVAEADFYQPADFGWTLSGCETRVALRKFIEADHADR